MPRAKVNANGFIGGVIDAKAQVQSTSELYNSCLQVGNNVIVKELGGAYRRSGFSIVAGTAEYGEYIYKITYFYKGEECLFVINSTGCRLIEGESIVVLENSNLNLTNEEVRWIKGFSYEDSIYIYVPHVGIADKSTRIIVVRLMEDPNDVARILVNIKTQTFTCPPFVPLIDGGDVQISNVTVRPGGGAEFVGTFLNGSFAIAQTYLGCEFLFKAEIKNNRWGNIPTTSPVDGVYWVRATLISIQDRKFLYNTSSNPFLIQAGGTDAISSSWYISAFTGNLPSGNGFFRNRPTDFAILHGRLYMCGRNALFASKVNKLLDFKYGSNEGDAFVELCKAEIFWICESGALFVGTNLGIFYIGGRQGDPISLTNISLRLCTSIRPNHLKAIQYKDGIIFVGADNYRVYHIYYENGNYQIRILTLLCSKFSEPGIISHAIQLSPFPIYWILNAEGEIASCVLSPDGILKWSNHSIGGNNRSPREIFILREEKSDVLYAYIQNGIGDNAFYTIERMGELFEEPSRDPDKKLYLDMGLSINYPAPLLEFNMAPPLQCNFVNNAHALQPLTDDKLDALNSIISIGTGSMVIAGLIRNASVIFNPIGLRYFELDKNGFKLIYMSLDLNNVKWLTFTPDLHPNIRLVGLFMSTLLLNTFENHQTVINGALYQYAIRLNFKYIPPALNLDGFLINFVGLGNVSVDAAYPLNLDLDIFFMRKIGDYYYLMDSGNNPLNIEIGDYSPSNNATVINPNRAKLLGTRMYISVNTEIRFGVSPKPIMTLGAQLYPDDIDRIHKFHVTSISGVRAYDFSVMGEIISTDSAQIKMNTPRYRTTYCYLDQNYLSPSDEFLQQYEDANLNPNMVVEFWGRFFLQLCSLEGGLFNYDPKKIQKIYGYFSRIEKDVIKIYIGTTVSTSINRNPLLTSLHLTDDSFQQDPTTPDDHTLYYQIGGLVWSYGIGVPYFSHLSPVPLIAGSMFGDSENMKGKQRRVYITLYKSSGGNYSSSPGDDKLYDIMYNSGLDNGSGTIEIPVDANVDSTRREVYITQGENAPFNVLNIVQDVNAHE